MHPSESNGYLVTVTCTAQSFLPYSDAVLFFTLPQSLPAGNQTANLTTNNLERPIFWCHLVFSFLAFILMWLVAQEPPVRGWQFMGCKTWWKKRGQETEKKRAWFDMKILTHWVKNCKYRKDDVFQVSKEWKSWRREQRFIKGMMVHL